MQTASAVCKWREACAEVLGVPATAMGRREQSAKLNGLSLPLALSAEGFETATAELQMALQLATTTRRCGRMRLRGRKEEAKHRRSGYVHHPYVPEAAGGSSQALEFNDVILYRNLLTGCTPNE